MVRFIFYKFNFMKRIFFLIVDTEGLDDEVRPGSNNTRGRSTKFCMVKQNGDYADSYYCNVYHNCHGGFDTIQYCTRGLVSKISILNY